MRFTRRARGPLNPATWYELPVTIEKDPGKGPPLQARQGDIFDNIPSLSVESRPLRVAREFQERSGRTTFTATAENESPTQPFRWADGEQVITYAKRGWAILLTQDCEIDKPNPHLIFAQVRLIDDSMREAVPAWQARTEYRVFYLGAQNDDRITFGPAVVNFSRLTTLRPTSAGITTEILPTQHPYRRYSLMDTIRAALRQALFEYMALDRSK